MGYIEAELSILIADDGQMTDLNREYRQIDHATDVLSFPMQEGEFRDISPEMLGDVVISAETADTMSRQTGSPLESIMHLLLVHGILHLAGYDHEGGKEDARKMREKTEDLLSMLGHSAGEFAWFFDTGD